MDYLLTRANSGDNEEELFRVFPWFIWYIWRVRNKFFSMDVIFFPIDTVDLAARECNGWHNANQEEEPEEAAVVWNLGDQLDPPVSICRVDGPWKNDETTSVVGWILQLQDGSINLLGFKGGHK